MNTRPQAQQTPLPKPKKQHIIIPNNPFHYVVGQQHTPINTTALQTISGSPFGKFTANQKFTSPQNPTAAVAHTKFGLVMSQTEAAMQRKRTFIREHQINNSQTMDGSAAEGEQFFNSGASFCQDGGKFRMSNDSGHQPHSAFVHSTSQL